MAYRRSAMVVLVLDVAYGRHPPRT